MWPYKPKREINLRIKDEETGFGVVHGHSVPVGLERIKTNITLVLES
jgi:hypothetical protein